MSASEWESVRTYLIRHAERLRGDAALLAELGLKLGNLVEFTPPNLARLEADKLREVEARKALEAVAEANFRTQTQIQSAVLELLDSRNHTDLARRIDESARKHFDLTAGVAGLEGPERAPVGWRALPAGAVDELLGAGRRARLGPAKGFEPLFGERGGSVRSMALVRLSLWEPSRAGLLAYGSPDPDHFTPAMGLELVGYLARVAERTAERWPVL